jgi:hypothetical protein
MRHFLFFGYFGCFFGLQLLLFSDDAAHSGGVVDAHGLALVKYEVLAL